MRPLLEIIPDEPRPGYQIHYDMLSLVDRSSTAFRGVP